MAIVGEATVVVRAVADKFRADLRREFAGAAQDADRFGGEAGGRFGASFSEGVRRNTSGSGVFSGLEREAGHAGDRAGRGFTRNFSRHFDDLDGVGRVFERLGADAVHQGERITQTFESAAGNAAQGAEDVAQSAEQAAGGIGGIGTSASEASSSGSSFMSSLAAKIVLLIPLVGVLGGGLAALVGGLTAVAAAAAYAAGSISILATGLGALALGGITAFLAFGGIGKAIGALGAQQAAAGKAALGAGRDEQAAADAIRSARERVEMATQALADAEWRLQQARQNAAEEAVRDAHAVEEAEYNLAQAQEEAQAAQEALTQARADARATLADLQLQLRGATLSEEEAALRLTEAQQAYQEVLNDPAATAIEREQARLNLEEAELNLDEAKRRKKEVQQETEAANAAGVAGSDDVVAARERIADANHDVSEATYALQQAQQQQADDAVEAAHSILEAQQAVANAQRDLADAQRALAEAQEGTAAGASALDTAANNVAAAMEHLSPKAQEFARYLYSLRPLLDKLRAAAGRHLFGPLTRDIQDLVEKFFPVLKRVVSDVGGGLADFFGELTDAFTSGDFLRNFEALGTALTKTQKGGSDFALLGRIIGNVVRALTGLAVAAEPVFHRFLRYLDDVTSGWANAFKSRSGMQSVTNTLKDMGDEAATFGHIFGGLFRLIQNVFAAALPVGRELTSSMASGLDRVVAATDKGTPGFERLQQFFENIREPLGAVIRFIGALGKQFMLLAESGAVTEVFDRMADALPTVRDAIVTFTEKVAPPMIDIIIKIVEAFNEVVHSPAFTIFVDIIKTIANVSYGLIKILTSGPIGKIVGVIAGIAAGFVVLYKAAWAVVGIAKTLFTVMQLMRANPWVLAITVLIVALVELYKHSETFRKILSVIGGALKTVGEFIKNVVVKSFDFLRDHLELLLLAFGPFGAVVLAVIEIFKHLGAIGDFVGKVVGRVVDFFQWLYDTLVGHSIVPDLIFGIIKFFAMLPIRVLRLVGKLILAIVHFFVGLAPKIWNALKTVIVRFAQFYVGAYKWMFTKLWDILKALVDIFEDLPGEIWDVLTDLIGKFVSFVLKAEFWLYDKIADILEAVIDFFKELPGRIWDQLLDLIVKFSLLVDKARYWLHDKIGEIIDAVVGFFKELPGRIWAFATDLATKLSGLATKVQTALRDKVRQYLDDVVTFFKELPGRIAQFATDLYNKAASIGSSIYNGIKDKIGNIASTVADWVGGIPGAIRDIATDVYNAGSHVMHELMQGMIDFFKGAGSFAVDVGEAIVNGLVDAINIGFTTINDLIPDKIEINNFPDIPLPDNPLPTIPNLAKGATILPTSGGTVVRLAEAGKPETVVDTGLINRRLAADEATRRDNLDVVDELRRIRAILAQVERLGGIHIDTIEASSTTGEPVGETVPRALRRLAFELGA